MATVQALVDGYLEMGPESIARFAASIEPEWVDEALTATGTASVRHRKLPAGQSVWLVLGICLFYDRSIRDVVDHLDLVVPGVKSLASSSVTKARYRLGEEPIEWLFRRVARAWSDSPGLGGFKGLRLFAVDGTTVRVPDTDENYAEFGKPTGRNASDEAAYPQARLAALLDLSTRLVVDAAFGPYNSCERTLAQRLWGSLTDDSLTILDRGFLDYHLWYTAVGGGRNRHLLVRMQDHMKFRAEEELADGSIRGFLETPTTCRKAHPESPDRLEVRVVGYRHPGGESSRLFTTLLDPKLASAAEIVKLYHERWEIELAFDELKTHMLERREALRSQRPVGVRQELWAMLLLYNLVRREMLLAAESFGVPPRQISFRSSLLWTRNFWLTAAMTSPANVPKSLAGFRSTLDVLLLPERRSERRYPRHVKIKMTRFPRNRGKRLPPKRIVEGEE